MRLRRCGAAALACVLAIAVGHPETIVPEMPEPPRVMPIINDMYSANPYAMADGLLQLQDSVFRNIAGAAYRAYQAEAEGVQWCYDETPNAHPALAKGWKGRVYHYRYFRMWSVHLLELHLLLQMDRVCEKEMFELRKLLVSTEKPPKGLSWWEDSFLPQLVEAFACDSSMTAQDWEVHPQSLPPDIAPVFAESGKERLKGGGRALVPRIWRLTKSYLTGPQKQRENPDRQQDFDVSLYIPFMGPLLPKGYPDWTKLAQMRVGYVTFNGPNIWHHLHMMSVRFQEAAARARDQAWAAQFQRRVVKAWKTMMTFFTLAGQPCPYCREHLLSRLSRNDQDYDSPHNKLKASQARIYPLEFLFLGAPDTVWSSRTAGTFESKLRFVDATKPESVMLFIWKLHNAVTSSVEYGEQCRTDEAVKFGASSPAAGTAESKMFQCSNTRCPRFHRAWPLLQRFEYWMEGGPTVWEQVRQNQAIVTAVQALDELDSDKTRNGFWERRETREAAISDGTVKKVMGAVAGLDAALVKAGVLQQQYGGICSDFVYAAAEGIEQTLDEVLIADVKAPLLTEEPVQCARATAAIEDAKKLPTCEGAAAKAPKKASLYAQQAALFAQVSEAEDAL